MEFSSSCFYHYSHISPKTNCWAPALISRISLNSRTTQPAASFAFTGKTPGLTIQPAGGFVNKLSSRRNFLGGSTLLIQLNPQTTLTQRKSSRDTACLPNVEIASTVFTLGTAAVLPFYTLMVVAPKAQLTRKVMEGSIPYIVFGLMYAYLLHLSWTPDTIRLMFASKYWLPELPGIVRMFSNEMTMASAWIHLLAVDLFAARQVYHDGLQNDIETRHSVSLCLLFCPVGILTHFITKTLTPNRPKKGQPRIH